MSQEKKGKRPAALVIAIGIFLSRIAGLVRERVFAYYLGNSDAAGAFRAALRIPNLLQNLFGEGVLSASFIPVYARLLAEGKAEEAGRVAGVMLTLLTGVVAILVALGVGFSRTAIDLLAPGFTGDVRELTIQLVRILFPGTGLLVLSAWCLGVLNSHRRFFLSYVAPVLWNLAIISGLVAVGWRFSSDRAGQMELVVWVAWSAVVGSALQFLIQLPAAISLNGGLTLKWWTADEKVRTIVKNFGPAVLARGVVQISAYIDQILASFLGPLSVAAMAYAQTLALLPVSLFGMAISAAELPEMASTLGDEKQVALALERRLTAGVRRIAFYVIPSVVAFTVLGEVVVATLFQTGRFGGADSRVVWYILAGYAVGLLASTRARLCVSVFWALGDTRTPLVFAVLRVSLSGLLGWFVTFPLRERLGIAPTSSAAWLAAFSGIASWVELVGVRWALARRIGRFSLGGRAVGVFWLCALGASALAFGVGRWLPNEGLFHHPVLRGGIVLGLYGGVYLGAAVGAGMEEGREVWALLLRRLKRDNRSKTG